MTASAAAAYILAPSINVPGLSTLTRDSARSWAKSLLGFADSATTHRRFRAERLSIVKIEIRKLTLAVLPRRCQKSGDEMAVQAEWHWGIVRQRADLNVVTVPRGSRIPPAQSGRSASKAADSASSAILTRIPRGAWSQLLGALDSAGPLGTRSEAGPG